MLLLRIFSFALIVLRSHASIRQEWSQPLEPATPKETHLYPAKWFHAQRLDHFTETDTRTWRQRFFQNFDHYRPGGPVILLIGGEGPMQSNRVGNSKYAYAWMAEQLHAAVVCLEHRFYGDSQPFLDSLATEHLQYLTSRQALHDLANFQRWFTAQHSLQASRFLCAGSSYSGNLAAWYRMEFPEMTAGCWAASAPVQATALWPGFGQMVWRGLSRDAFGKVDESPTVKLYAGYQMLAQLIQDPTPASGIALRKRLKSCPGNLATQEDRDSWETALVTAVGGIVQSNTSASVHFSQIQALVNAAASPLDAAWAVVDFLNLTSPGPNGCVDNSISSFYSVIENETVPLGKLGLTPRPWMWQSCNEFGYFQTASAEIGVSNFYTHGVSNRALNEAMCAEIFGISDLSARVAETNAYYGGSELSSKKGRELTRVLFSNGELDAWSLLSILDTSKFPGRDLHAVVGALGSHTEGTFAPASEQVPGGTHIRETALHLFRQWAAPSENADRSKPVIAYM